MGHIGQKALSKLPNASKRIEYFKNASEHKICEICAQTNLIFKVNKNPFDKINTFLKSVFLNICGSIKPFTSSKKRYFATFLDQATKWLEIRLLSNKNDIIQVIKNYIIFQEKQLKHFIKKFHADNAKKYIAQKLKFYYIEKNINSSFSIFYTSQQNGVAERINRILLNKIRAMLIQAKLLNKF